MSLCAAHVRFGHKADIRLDHRDRYFHWFARRMPRLAILLLAIISSVLTGAADSITSGYAQVIGEFIMPISVKQLMEAANAAVPKITRTQAQDMIAKGNALVLDVRDAPELEKTGKIAGAVHHSRGMLEFRADPESPYFDRNFSKDKVIIVYCASGGRSALAGKLLKDMGYDQVHNLGAFKDWVENGGAIEKPIDMGM